MQDIETQHEFPLNLYRVKCLKYKTHYRRQGDKAVCGVALTLQYSC